jgi:hypothetical protein
MAVPEEPSSGYALWARAIAVTAVVVSVTLAGRRLRPLVMVGTFLGAPATLWWARHHRRRGLRAASWLASPSAPACC